jgi:hypothetical protein
MPAAGFDIGELSIAEGRATRRDGVVSVLSTHDPYLTD